MKLHTIASGSRRSRPLAYKGAAGSVRFSCSFDKSCEYILSPQAPHPFNILCGVSYPEDLNTQVAVGWRYNYEFKKYELAIMWQIDGREFLTKSSVNSWPRSNSVFNVMFKVASDSIFVYVTGTGSQSEGLVEVVTTNINPDSTLQRIVFPRFNAGQGAPQKIAIKLKYGKY